MNRQELIIYTQDHSHHGVNSLQVLNNYLNYVSLSKDPQNIFRFMEEKAICIFLPTFWLAKANYLAEIGDYTGCFQCIQVAFSYTDEDEVQTVAILNQRQIELRRKLIDDMRQFPLSTKRSASQFNFQASLESGKVGKSKQQQLLKVYQGKYKALRQQKQRKAIAKRDKLPLSWLSELYKKEDEVQKMIQQKIQQNSLRVSRDMKYYSMHTPIRVRDPQRLTKTMDSVQMLKKKRSTREKDKKNAKYRENDSQQEDNFLIENSNRMMNSLPVGRKFTKLKRRVTFQHDSLTKNQKTRSQSEKIHSYEKLLISSKQYKKEQKMEQESEQAQIHSQPISKQ